MRSVENRPQVILSSSVKYIVLGSDFHGIHNWSKILLGNPP
jgi:hypothetical protein